MTNLKGRAFAAYLGSEVVGTQHGHGYLRGVDLNRRGGSIMVEYDKNLTPDEDYITNSQATHIDKVKLLLKPLSSISDEDSIEVVKIILKRDAQPYNYTFNQIHRINYDNLSGCDAEECVIVCMDATPVDDSHKIAGWEDTKFRVKIVERDRYNSKPYFNISALHKDKWINWSGNELEAFDYLRSRSYNLPFMGKDLIKENIAIIKTDVSKTM